MNRLPSLRPRTVHWIADLHTRRLVRGQAGRGVLVTWIVCLILTVWSGLRIENQVRATHGLETARIRQVYTTWVRSLEPGTWRPIQLTTLAPLALVAPPPPLASLARGLRTIGGSWAMVRGYHLTSLEGRVADRDPSDQVPGALDLASAVAVIGALCVLVLGHDAICAEHETGLLEAHLAHGVSPLEHLGGKILGTWSAVWRLLAIPLGLALGALLVLGPWPMSLAIAGRIGSFWLGSLMLLGTWTLLAITLSVWTRRASTAMLVLVSVWLALTLVWPGAMRGITDAREPIPDPARTEERIVQAVESAKAVYRDGIRTFRERHGRSPEGPELGAIRLEYVRYVLDRVTRHVCVHAQARHRWNETFERLAGASPPVSFHAVARELAGTDVTSQERVLESANMQLHSLKLLAERRAIAGQDEPPSFEDLPRFTVIPPAWTERLVPITRLILVTGIWWTMLLCLATLGISGLRASAGRVRRSESSVQTA